VARASGSVSAVLHHLALAAAVASLAAAGVRLASLAAPSGIERALAAFVFATAAAVAEALGLGLVGLGGSAVAVLAAAVATWAAARLALPAPGTGVAAELGRWLRELGLAPRLVLGAAAGLLGAWGAWLAVHPALGRDMVVYHVPEAVDWVHNGRPGSVVPVIADLAVGSYQLTYEVLLAWGLTLGRGFDWVTLVTAATPAVVGVAAWAGLRALCVDRVPAFLGAAALVAPPAVLATQRGGSSVDPASMAYLVTAGALFAAARQRPRLAAPAILAAGMAVGCKATALPLAGVVVVVGLVGLRGRLGALRPWLGGATAVAIAVGGVWYIRNLVAHGSPLWPFEAAPWGDPRPRFYDLYAPRFLDAPRDALSRLWPYYRADFGGELVLLGGALLAALLVRRRAVLAATVAALVSVALWTNAPFTGISQSRALDEGVANATRFLLPGVAAAVLAIALATRRRRFRPLGIGLLAVAAAIGLRQTLHYDYPTAPSGTVPLAGTLAGAALALGSLGVRRLPRVPRPVVAGLAIAAGAGIGVAVADGFAERNADTGQTGAGAVRWLARQPAWREGDAPVVATVATPAPLTGDRLQHRLVLATPRVACARAARLRAWLVVDRARMAECGKPDYEDPLTAVYAPPLRVTSLRPASRARARQGPRPAAPGARRNRPGASATAPGARSRSS
jgi:hypothetical protein